MLHKMRAAKFNWGYDSANMRVISDSQVIPLEYRYLISY